MIDFATCHYGYFEEDLSGAYNGVFRDTELYNHFLESYLAHRNEGIRERYQRTQKIFFSYFYLEKTSSATVRWRKYLEKEAPEETVNFWRQRALNYWQHFVKSIEA